jgi:hypothetical protein
MYEIASPVMRPVGATFDSLHDLIALGQWPLSRARLPLRKTAVGVRPIKVTPPA